MQSLAGIDRPLATMIFVFTVLMHVCQFIAINLLVFLAYRYRANIASIRRPGPKVIWSRIFTLFIISAVLTEALTWTQSYLKCMDTSGDLQAMLGPRDADAVCRIWLPLDVNLKKGLFTVYLIFELIAVCSFQALVLERYRKVSDLFPTWASKYALPTYTALYIPIGIMAILLSLLEFYISPSTIISRNATINTISSAVYCVWIVLTGLTDAVLSFLIVTKVRRGRRDYQHDQEGAAKYNQKGHMSISDAAHRETLFKPLRRLQIFFAAIILFDMSILCLTVLKKMNSHGIHGRVFAYEVASIEIACTIVHCTMTLCFMQLLGATIRSTQPQFEFIVGSQESNNTIHVVEDAMFKHGPVSFSWTSKASDEGSPNEKPSVEPFYSQREIAPDDVSMIDGSQNEDEIQVVRSVHVTHEMAL